MWYASQLQGEQKNFYILVENKKIDKASKENE